MDQMGLATQDKLNIYSTVAAVLHLGNINFEDDPESTKGGCKITSTTEQSLNITAEMLGLDQRDLRNALITRILMTKTTSSGKGTVIPLVFSFFSMKFSMKIFYFK
jgi:myosin-6